MEEEQDDLRARFESLLIEVGEDPDWAEAAAGTLATVAREHLASVVAERDELRERLAAYHSAAHAYLVKLLLNEPSHSAYCDLIDVHDKHCDRLQRLAGFSVPEEER